MIQDCKGIKGEWKDLYGLFETGIQDTFDHGRLKESQTNILSSNTEN